jgi:BirA family biotin operon repressor/biotin-[acetyl-CoA-carboxylase] ligase
MSKNIHWDFQEIDTCDSTNLEIKKWLQNGKAKVGTVLSAKNQTQGRGRFDRKWESPKGNIAMTFVAPTPHNIQSVYQLNIIMALSLSKTINGFLKLDSKIKWPNDVLIHDLKVAGILSELFDQEKCILGVGINLNSAKSDFSWELNKNLTTLKEEYGQEINREKFIKNFLDQTKKDFETYFESGFQNRLPEIHVQMAWLGKKVIITEQKDQPYTAKLLNLDENGFLRVVTESGVTKKILAGDVRLG